MALDSIQLSKLKVIHNLDAVDMNMQKLVSIQKTMLGLLVFAIVAIVLNLVFIVLFTYIQYRDLIKVVDSAAIQGAPGGLATAFACKFGQVVWLFEQLVPDCAALLRDGPDAQLVLLAEPDRDHADDA
jgi:hypothetical protein